MHRIFRFVGALLFFATTACTHHTIIPDDELALIFHDAFLTNAYINNQSLKVDSLNIYEPNFARYGYTTEDVHYTIGNFSKRKSARLGDVIEQAIDLLEEEGKFYDREVAALDTIDNVAARSFTRTVFRDSLRRVRRLSDTARLALVWDVAPGEYQLDLNYLVDSLDKNTRGLKVYMWLERNDSTRSAYYTTTLRRNRMEHIYRSFTTDSTHRRLRIRLLNFSGKPERPSVTVSDLKLNYIPPVAAAVDSLYRQQLDIRIFADEFFRAAHGPLPKKDSIE